MLNPSIHRLDLGGFRVTSILAGRFSLDGGAMYGVVPRPLWSRATPPDDRHRIPMTCNCLLVEADSGERVLFDAGIGQRFDERGRDLFAVDGNTSLTGSLRLAGTAPEQITHVLFSHLHFDHCAGALVSDSGRLRPTFPDAIHLVQDGEIEDGMRGHSIMKSSYVSEDIECLRASTRFEGIDGNQEILPGLSVEITGGHTAHHQAIWLHGGDQSLVYPADLLPTRQHLRPYWIMAYDMFPHDTLTTKGLLSRRILDDQCIIAWDHDPGSPFSRLSETNEGVVAIDVETA